MYVCAVLFLGSGFKKPQTFFNILNENAALLILSCGMSLVMITGGIDISVGTLTALVCMSCAVNLDYQGGTVRRPSCWRSASARRSASCRAS